MESVTSLQLTANRIKNEGKNKVQLTASFSPLKGSSHDTKSDKLKLEKRLSRIFDKVLLEPQQFGYASILLSTENI
jgi:hypothetical protein